MEIWGVSMVRDEADIVELTVRHMLDQGLDQLLIADNLSRDGTREILDRLSHELPLTIVDDAEPAYRQAEKMTALANQAAKAGAAWIVPFDADELWRGRDGTVRDAIHRSDANILAAAQHDHLAWPTLRRGSVVERMPRTRAPEWSKVAFRWRPGAQIAMGNHVVNGIAGEPEHDRLLIDHYPYRSFKQFQRKVRQGALAVDLAGAPPEVCYHWRAVARRPAWRIRVDWWVRRLR